MQNMYGYFDYYIEAGDTYGSLAKKFMLSEKELKGINENALISRGSRLKIPCRSGGCVKGAFYVIKKGDTLGGIARRRGITLEELLRMNPYLNPSYYLQGQIIVLPYSGRAVVYYTLGKNERLSDVFRNYNMDLTTFCALNPDISPAGLKAGQRIRIVREAGPYGSEYTLIPGDTIVSVAERFGISAGELLGANRNIKPREFVAGVTVRIPESDRLT